MSSDESSDGALIKNNEQEMLTENADADLRKVSLHSDTVQQSGGESDQNASREHGRHQIEESGLALCNGAQAKHENSQITKDCGYGLDEPLFKAIEENNLTRVKELISEGANVNLVTRVYGGHFFPLVYTPLILAAERNRFEIFEALLGVPEVNVNQTDHYGSTVLHEASKLYFGSRIVKLLLEREDVDVNQQDTKFGYTPLHNASINHCTETVRLLLDRENIDVNVKDKDDGFTPLHHAIVENHDAAVKLLLQKKGVDVNVKDSEPGSTPLTLASRLGTVEVVKSLLGAEGIDVNARNTGDRSTALHEASEQGHGGVVKLLLGKTGINVNARNASGLTPLQEASKAGNSEIVDLLLANQAENLTKFTDH